MIRYKIILLLLFGMALCSCHTIRPNNSGNYPATLIFGQGGGVSGKYMEYSLVVDGTLYRHELPDGDKVFLRKLNKKDTRDFFIMAETMDLLHMDFNEPYNINYYIVFLKGTYSNRVNWGNSLDPPPNAAQELYDKLWRLTKQK